MSARPPWDKDRRADKTSSSAVKRKKRQRTSQARCRISRGIFMVRTLLLSKLSIPLQGKQIKKSPQRAQLGRGASIVAGTTNGRFDLREHRHPGCQEEKRVPEESRNTDRARETVIKLDLSGTGSEREERNRPSDHHPTASVRAFSYTNPLNLTTIKNHEGFPSPSSGLSPTLCHFYACKAFTVHPRSGTPLHSRRPPARAIPRKN